jgi:hypothetical protein
MIVIAAAGLYSVADTIIQRHSGIVYCFINQLRILFVVGACSATTCISLSSIKAAACFAMWSLLLFSDATPHVMQSAFVHAYQ